MKKNSGLVYSTETGRHCSSCGQPQAQCLCRKKEKNTIPSGSTVKISRQTKGRRGSSVSLISGIPLPADQMKILAKDLKKICGSGGTLKNGIIEIQGDHRELLMEQLTRRGFKVKLAGG